MGIGLGLGILVMKGELMSAGQQTTEFVWKWRMTASASGAQYNN